MSKFACCVYKINNFTQCLKQTIDKQTDDQNRGTSVAESVESKPSRNEKTHNFFGEKRKPSIVCFAVGYASSFQPYTGAAAPLSPLSLKVNFIYSKSRVVFTNYYRFVSFVCCCCSWKKREASKSIQFKYCPLFFDWKTFSLLLRQERNIEQQWRS